MPFYKKQKITGKWFPRSITMGTYGTEEVTEWLSRMSTVSKGDTYAMLAGLGEVLATGRSVKIYGVGTFMLVGVARGRGADTPEEVSAEQFHDLRVRFIPEYRRGGDKKVRKRTIVPRQVEWIEWKDGE